jgi:hypothetical protein
LCSAFQEAVELLSQNSGLDSAAVAPTLLEVAKLCGRKPESAKFVYINVAYCLGLPLCLNIASNLIAASGSSWEEEVLPDLRADLSKFLVFR